ncbi:UNVERIFIED_CONTAM: hypothetical protein Slati_4191500 [Sesamum latifolium]|uniref:Uncharacterized protein n=1 Tax=Sesamum latifolium TaxID=2727402 RepID=A0AAW2T9N8_9LAMI
MERSEGGGGPRKAFLRLLDGRSQTRSPARRDCNCRLKPPCCQNEQQLWMSVAGVGKSRERDRSIRSRLESLATQNCGANHSPAPQLPTVRPPAASRCQTLRDTR